MRKKSADIVDEALSMYGNKRENLLQILQHVQSNLPYIDSDAMKKVALGLDISAAKVESVASFYHYLHIAPAGRYRIYVCGTIGCHMKGGKNILSYLCDVLRIGMGQVTEDGLFSIHQTSCLGQCDRAPAMMINDMPFTQLTEQKIMEILDDFRNHQGKIVVDRELQ